MERIKILPHNKEAYQCVVDANNAGQKRACVIHPTGTGKSFIAAQLINDHMEESILYLTSYISILCSAKETTKAVCGMYPKDFTMDVYSNIEETMLTKHYDVIILDEFHRCGAETWNINVLTILANNPNAFVLGLSATPIRYLDNNRDMSDELFDGKVVSQMTTGEAIARGILPFPRYITCAYSFQKDFDKLEKRLNHCQNKELGNECLNELEKAKRHLQNGIGIKATLKKFITKKDGKYIVFCRSYNHLQQMIKMMREWLSEVNTSIDVRVLYSAQRDKNMQYLHEFEADNRPGIMKLLFVIDMLNEGVHAKGLDGEFMLRPTCSGNVYYQQLGRALSAGSADTKPLIFDIVCNLENTKQANHFFKDIENAYMKYGLNFQKEFTRSFYMDPVTKDTLSVFKKIEQRLPQVFTWMDNYNICLSWYEEHGNLLIPKRYITEDGVAIGSWIMYQKIRYKNHLLSDEHTALLNSLGIIWDIAADAWECKFILAKKYYEEHGDLQVPATYKVDGECLGEWIRTQRKDYRNKKISKEREYRLNEIGMSWSAFEDRWEAQYQKLALYVRTHGNMIFPEKEISAEDKKTFHWVSNQKTLYKQGVLRQDRIEKLERLNIKWEVTIATWDNQYLALKSFYEENGVSPVPKNVIIEGKNLNYWVGHQKRYYKEGKLSQERIDKLLEIGFIF